MYFRKQDQVLLGSDGKVMRRFHCPMEGKELRMVWESPDTLRCQGCQHSVRLAWNLDESELKALIEKEPEHCLLIPKQTKHITQLEDTDATET